MPYQARLTFAGLWCYADKSGRLEDRPKFLKISIFPYDNIDMEKQLQLLTNHKPFINRYEVDGKKYIQIVNWNKHQKPHHTERNSFFPPPQNSPTPPMEKGMGMGSVDNPSAPTNNVFLTVKNTLKQKNQLFQQPTLNEVSSYCQERGRGVNPEKWMAHYEANGWKVGKNPMKNWKAAVRTWETEITQKQKEIDLERERVRNAIRNQKPVEGIR